jgi:hypothetical protein
MSDLRLKNRAAETLLFLNRLDRIDLVSDMTSGTRIPNWLKALLQEVEMVQDNTRTLEYYRWTFLVNSLKILSSTDSSAKAEKMLQTVSINDALTWLASDESRLRRVEQINKLHQDKLPLRSAIKGGYRSEAKEVYDLVVQHLTEAIERGTFVFSYDYETT